jgi:hypothetical protein
VRLAGERLDGRVGDVEIARGVFADPHTGDGGAVGPGWSGTQLQFSYTPASRGRHATKRAPRNAAARGSLTGRALSSRRSLRTANLVGAP